MEPNKGITTHSSAAARTRAKEIPAPNSQDGVLKRINALQGLTMKDLKEQYLALYPGAVAPNNRLFVIRRVAYRLQENAFGSLPLEARDRLDILKAELNPLKDLGRKATRTPAGKPARRVPLPGTIITKTYKGNPVSVKVLEKGFEYEGKPYRSLSRVAREVTGVHQSGFVFFGV